MAPAREAPKPKIRLRRDGPSLIARTKQKAALEETYSEAVTWCRAQGCSARKALSSGLFDEGLSRSTLQRRLKDDMRKANTTSILTTNEENDLVEWVQEKNREHGGVGRQDVAVKICQMLEVRQAMRRLNFDKKYEALSKNANVALKNGGPSEYPS